MSALKCPVLGFSIVSIHRSVLKVRGTKIDLFYLEIFFFLISENS